MYRNREVFAEPPLALVAAEVRYSYSPRLRRQEELDQIIIALDSWLPVVQPKAQISVVFGPEGGVQQEAEQPLVLTNVGNTESLTLSSSRFAFEATHYKDFPTFSASVRRICDAIAAVGVTPVVERIGLRYIDEIRVPETIDGPLGWRGWVNEVLVDSASVAGDFTAHGSEGVVMYALDGAKSLNFRFGAVDGEPVVGGLLTRRQTTLSGPFFVLDADAFATYPAPQVMTVDEIISTLDELHTPAGVVFQGALTDKTRNLFRGGADQ